MTYSWRAQVFYICLIAVIAKSQSFVPLSLVVIVLVVKDDARLFIIWVNGALNVVRWIY